MSKMIDVIKYEGDNSTFIWKHPCEDFYSMTQLIVHESQEAIFFMNGEALDTFGPGRHTLETQNIPKLGRFLNRTAGDDTPFHCEVYFINQTVQMALKWGTDSRVRYIDPESGVPLELGASGEMNLRVSDGRKLLLKVVGTMNGIAWGENGTGFTQSLSRSFRPVISTAVKSHLTTTIKAENINIFEVDEHLEQLSAALRSRILPAFEEYGLTIPQFYLTTVMLPEDNPNFKRLRELHTIALQTRMAQAEAQVRTAQVQADAQIRRAQAEADAGVFAAKRLAELEKQTTETEIARREAERQLIHAQAEADVMRAKGFAEAEIMHAKGYNEKDIIQADVQKAFAAGIGNMGSGGNAGGSAMSDIVGLGIGLQAANAMGGQLSGLFAGMNGQQAQPAQPTQSAPAEAPAQASTCAKCGAALPAGAKFCLECGEKVAPAVPDGMVCCPSCGKIVVKGKFCPECGSRLAAVCPKCGAELPAGAKFCLECGEKL